MHLIPSRRFYDVCLFSNTTGYGDTAPSTSGGLIFASLFAFIGVSYIGLCVGFFTSNYLDRQEKQIQAVLSKNDDSEESSNLPSILSFILALVTLVFLTLYIGDNEGWNFTQSIYFGVITATTVGYGDYFPTHNRLFASIYLIFTTGITAVFLGAISEFIVSKKQKMVLKHFESKKLQWRDIEIMMKHELKEMQNLKDKSREELRQMAKDSNIVTKAQYVEYMLTKMNVVSEDLIKAIHKSFDQLDIDQNNFVSKEEVSLILLLSN